SNLTGIWDPYPTALSAYKLMAALGDPKASELLTHTYRMFRAQAERLSLKETQKTFLLKRPAHRELIELYSEL
ncbi:MAG: hypothetical protein AAF633_20715, partial [Chloroflexota bacterium]